MALDVGLHRQQASSGLGELEDTHSNERGEGAEVADEVVHAMLLLRYCHDSHHLGREVRTNQDRVRNTHQDMASGGSGSRQIQAPHSNDHTHTNPYLCW
jgi:hypothetical protein